MDERVKSFLPKIAWYIVIWIVVAFFVFFGLRYRKHLLYSQNKYDELVSTVSPKRQKAIDPCQFFIWGDPPNAEGNFAKVIFYCDKQKKTVNSLDLSVLKTANYRELIQETGRINGFSTDQIVGEDHWKCFADHQRISDFSTRVKLKSRVECFFDFSDEEIITLYAKN